MYTLANRENPDDMQHNALFSMTKTIFKEIEYFFYLVNRTCNPWIQMYYIQWTIQKLIVLNQKQFCAERVNYFSNFIAFAAPPYTFYVVWQTVNT